MHAGTIEWNGADLSRIGKPKLVIQRQPDPPAPAFATRMLVSLTVTVDLEALDPGTIQARAQWLADSMKVPEGILRISSGSGHVLEWLAVPGENSLAEAITGSANSVSLTFSATENMTTANLSAATFTPAGSPTPLHLHAVREYKEEIRTNRHSERNSARAATTTSISFTARAAQSNAADPHACRLAWLQAKAAEIKALNTMEGTLVIGALNAIVRVSEFSPMIDERRGVLDVQVQCHFVSLPDAGTAECSIEIETGTEEGSGEHTISIKGEIAAETRNTALAKLNSLRSAQLNTPGQRVISYTSSDKLLDGYDTSLSEDDWGGALSFAIEVRKPRAGGHGNLRITTQTDIRSGMRWNYNGSVRAATEAEAIATSRGFIAQANHPVMTRSEEVLDRVTDIENPEVMHPVKLDFTYEFEGPSNGFISGEIQTETSTPLAGEWRDNISGFLIAETRQAAEDRLALLSASAGTMLEKSIKWSEVYHDISGNDAQPKRVAMRMDFNYSVRRTRSRNRAAAEFTDTTQVSIANMRMTRSISGVLWSSTSNNATAALATLYALIFGDKAPQESSSSHSKLRFAPSGTLNSLIGTNADQQWIKLDFSASSIERLTGVVGYDLLEASMTMSRDGSIDSTIITPVAFGRPVAQTNTGYVPGRISITASAKAVNLTTARTWVQGRRALVNGIGVAGTTRHETDQPRETATPDYAPFDGSVPASWTFAGTYGWTFTGSVLDGIWVNSLPS